jgi:hypothetical protein
MGRISKEMLVRGPKSRREEKLSVSVTSVSMAVLSPQFIGTSKVELCPFLAVRSRVAS